MPRWIRLLTLAAFSFALASCSTARHVKLSEVTALYPIDRGPLEAHAMRFTTRDDAGTQHEGLLVPQGDSLIYYRGVEGEWGLSRETPHAIYVRERVWRDVPIRGYVTADGRRHEWEGVLCVRGDSLEFFSPGRRPRGLGRTVPAETMRLPRDLVTGVDADFPDVVRTIVAVTGVALFFAALAFAGLFFSMAGTAWY